MQVVAIALSFSHSTVSHADDPCTVFTENELSKMSGELRQKVREAVEKCRDNIKHSSSAKSHSSDHDDSPPTGSEKGMHYPRNFQQNRGEFPDNKTITLDREILRSF